ncbi:MAG: hypothetical protein ABJD07_12880 [Gemmatimonadaceae bacterium]
MSERNGIVSYDMTGPRFRLRLDGTGLRYVAPGSTINGSTPIAGRLDFVLRPGDTLTFVGQTGSNPAQLDSAQAAAIGHAGSSAIDLESFAFGAPAMFGGRGAFAFPVGDLVLSLRGGIEAEPRPSAREPVYWQGTTMLGGVTLAGDAGPARLAARVDVRRSFADSLGGKNLFPGGGSVTTHASLDSPLSNPFDDLGEDLDLRLSAFYSSPFGDTRNDQPNRLIPLGNTLGTFASLAVPVSDWILSPSIQYIRETSSADAVVGAIYQRSSAAGWSASFGLDALIPLTSVFDLAPQVGYVTGNVEASFGQSVVRRRGRPIGRTSAFSHGVRGWWAGLDLTASF